MQNLKGLSIPYANQLLFLKGNNYDKGRRCHDEMNRGTVRVEWALVPDKQFVIRCLSLSNLKYKYLRLVGANIESIIVKFNAAYILGIGQFDGPEIAHCLT
jgi:hypothetical protein